MMVSLDEAVGTITAALQSAGVAGNTVVAFLGDNGSRCSAMRPYAAARKLGGRAASGCRSSWRGPGGSQAAGHMQGP